MGMVSAFCRVAVVILAVQERPGPDLVGRIVHGDHDFEILGFLAGNGALRGRHAGGAQDGGIADLGHVAFESLVGNGVDGDVRRLAQLDVDDIGFIHLHFGGDQRHIGDGHDDAALGILNAGHHGFAHAHGQVGHHAIERRVAHRACAARR